MDINFEILRVYLGQKDICMASDMQRESNRSSPNARLCLRREKIGNARTNSKYLRLCTF
jgi:hypothetical protein